VCKLASLGKEPLEARVPWIYLLGFRCKTIACNRAPIWQIASAANRIAKAAAVNCPASKLENPRACLWQDRYSTKMQMED
jgi:hypothetical protein